MSTVLTINGSTVNRTTARVVLNRLTLSMDGADSLEFTELRASLPGSYRQGYAVTLTVDGTLRFTGVIVALYPAGIGTGSISVGYRCLGLDWLANQIAITAGDGTGRMVFNLPSTDEDYIPSNSGLSVGAILKRLYDGHAAQLLAAGVTAYSSGELSALTVVPNEPVVLSGRLWNAVLELLATYCNKYGAWISADGVIHHPNLLSLSTSTLTLDSDPVILGGISEDFSECYTQVVLRGAAWVEGAYLSLSDGTLAARWTAAQQAAWTYADYVQPKGAFELGTIGSMTSTTLSVTSTDPASISYAANYWSTLNAEVWAYTTSGSNVAQIGFMESRRITANTAPASNSYTLTVDTAFSNSGYDHYSIRGAFARQSLTWRAFDVVPSYVAQHLVKRLSHSTPWSPTDGIVVQTTSPMAVVCFTQGGQYVEWPMSFQIVPSDGSTNCTTIATCTATTSAGAVTGFTSLSGGAGYPASSSSIPVSISGGGGSGASAHAVSNGSGVITSVVLDAGGSGYTSAPRVVIGSSPGYIVFDQPICAAYTSLADMNAGGATVAAPSDLKVLVPYSRGAISVTAPATGYEGTAYTVNNVQRTLYREFPQWTDYRDLTSYQTLAQETLDTLKNTVIEGSLTYLGKWSTGLTLGRALNLAGNGYTTGYEAMAAPIRSVVLDYCPEGGASPWITRLGFSTRMRPFCGDRVYTHPAWGAGASGFVGQLGFAAATAAGRPSAGGAAELLGFGDVAGTASELSGAAASSPITGELTNAMAGFAGDEASTIDPAAIEGLGSGAPAPRRRLTQQEQVARDRDKEFNAGMKAMDDEMRRTSRADANRRQADARQRMRPGDYDPVEEFNRKRQKELDAQTEAEARERSAPDQGGGE